MSVQTWTFVFVGLSFSLYIGVAFWSRARSTGDFYVAGGSVHPVVNGMATAADWMSAASFISMAGIISFMGRDGSVYLMGWTGGYVLLALLIAPYLRKFGRYTVPDFVGDRYYSQAARIVAVVCTLFVSFTYVAGQMRGVGIVFSRFLDVDIETGVAIGMGIVFFYAVLGGMKGITYTQVVQYCVLIFAYLVPAIFISIHLTGNPIPQLGFGGSLADGSGLHLLERLDGLSRELGFSAYTEGRKSTIDVFFITAALMLGTAGLPHVIVRFYTVKKAAHARSSAGYALVFIALLYTTAPAVAAFARTNLLAEVAETSYAEAPKWFGDWERTGLIKWQDKNADGRIQYLGDKERNELDIDKDIMVLANPEIAGLPSWVIALVVAGALAAALSTAAGLLLVIGAAVSHDLFKKALYPRITEKQELLAARVAVGVAVVIAGYFGIRPPGFVAEVVAFAFGLAAASFFPAIVLGIFWKRMNREGAIAGMSCGILFTAGYIYYFKFYSPVSNVVDNWLFGVSPEGIGTVGMLLNLGVSIVVSLVTSPPPENMRASARAADSRAVAWPSVVAWGMSGTEAGTRPLGAEEVQLIEEARQRAGVLYRGEEVPHHSCGAAVAVTFSVSARPYQSLRRGGITGERFCGSIRAGEILLGELLGDADPTGAVTDSLREAITWYQEQIPKRFDRGESADYVCNNLVAALGDFSGTYRKRFCTSLTSEVAALTMEAILRFAPELAPQVSATSY